MTLYRTPSTRILKGIIIGGVPRSGKSTLSRRLARRFGHSRIPSDPFISSFGGVMPQAGICHEGVHAEICDRFEPFIIPLLNHFRDDEGLSLVFDTFHLRPETLARSGLLQNHAAVYLGYPNLSIDEKLAQIRSHVVENDWTVGRPDRQLQEWLERYIAISRDMQQQCRLNGIDFIDVGDDFQGALKNAESLISAKLGASPPRIRQQGAGIPETALAGA